MKKRLIICTGETEFTGTITNVSKDTEGNQYIILEDDTEKKIWRIYKKHIIAELEGEF